MTKPFSIMIVGGGLAGMAAGMKLAELGCQVGMMSLLPMKRSHSACARAASTASTTSPGSWATMSGSTSRIPSTAAISWPISRP